MNSALVIIPLFIIVFHQPLFSIIKGWGTTSLSYGFLIFCMSVYIIWSRRNYFKSLPVRPALLGGSLLTAAGCLLFLGGTTGNIEVLQHLALITTLLGLIWMLYGFDYFRTLLFPVGYLVFMFPVFGMALGKLSPFLQTASAWLASSILWAAGMDVFRESQTILLPHITLEVARECSGVHHIIALAAVAVPLAYITQKTFLKQIIVVIAAFVIGIAVNGLRVAIIGIWLYFQQDASVHGPMNALLISVFVFGPGLVVLLVFATCLNRMSPRQQAQAPDITLPPPAKFSSSYKAVLTASVILALTATVNLTCQAKPVRLSTDISDLLPYSIAGWNGSDMLNLQEPFDEALPDNVIKREYSNGEGTVLKVYVGYFALQQNRKELYNQYYNLPFKASNQTDIIIDAASSRKIKKARYNILDKDKTVYYSYIIDGRPVNSQIEAKWLNLRDTLLQQRNNGAIMLIVKDPQTFIAADANSPREIEFVQAVTRILITKLP